MKLYKEEFVHSKHTAPSIATITFRVLTNDFFLIYIKLKKLHFKFEIAEIIIKSFQTLLGTNYTKY